jgi:hypothetical protein
MSVWRRERETKEKGTDEDPPPTARAIDPLETLARNRSCNWITVSVNSVVDEPRAEEAYLPEERPCQRLRPEELQNRVLRRRG